MLLVAPDTFATRDSKGKGRARDLVQLDARDEGAGGSDGIVIPLQLLQQSAYESVYVAPVFVGASPRQFLLQVDTGSSDLWIASTSCSTSPCNAVGGNRYDPSQAVPAGVPPVTVSYAEGEASGPIVWDSVQLGGYSIDNQALMAASTVNAEPLSSDFAGVLGLALPLNSLIAKTIPPTTSDAPDGASLSSNLFGITPLNAAPPSRFLSIALERPGSDKVSSTLGIGRHPADLVPDPSKVQYSTVVAQSLGSQWWQANVRAITVYVNGQAKVVPLPLSSTGTNGQPSAILDTGTPLIIASSNIAYGIYGAMGYSPAADGTVYIPCNQPLNMTITLDDRSEIPIHPLDLTYYPPGDPSAENCIGAIQTPAQIGATITQADMVLGVPFLRNTYTVLGYDVPTKGVFPNNTGASERVQPRLGLLPLTDPATAAAEFHQVRVLRQPISGGGNTSGDAATQAPTKKGLSVGIEVLIGLLGFFGLCFVLFSARLLYMKRKYRRAPTAPLGGIGDSKNGSYVLNELGYEPAARKSHSREPSEDELRLQRYEAYKRKRDLESTYTDSTKTRVADGSGDEGEGEGGAADEFGALTGKTRGADSPEERFRDPWAEATLTPDGRPPLPSTLLSPSEVTRPAPTARRSSYTPASPLAHHRTPSGGASAAAPLLAHGRSYSTPQTPDADSGDIAEFGMPAFERERPVSMAGVGTSGRSRHLGSGGSAAALQLPASPSSAMSPSERASRFPLPPSPLLSPTRPVTSPLARESVYGTPAPSPLLSPTPPSPRALDPVYSSSRNESRVSEIGHDV